MNSHRKPMPPIRWLYVFEAAARYENFTKAAQATFVTQAAISKTIKSLEDNLQCQLFTRHGRTVKLTQAGRDLYERTRSAFDYLEDGCSRLRADSTQKPVTILANSAVSHYWLGPLLRQYSAANPDSSVRLISSDRKQDWIDGDHDLAILYDDVQRLTWQLHHLFDEGLYPAASSSFVEQQALTQQLPLSIEQLLALPILDYERKEANWNNFTSWVNRTTDENKTPTYKATQIYSNYDLAVEAMLDDKGVTLISQHLAPANHKGLSITQLSDDIMYSGRAYYLGYPNNSKLSAEALSLKAFLLANK